MPFTNYDAATHTSAQLIDALFLNKNGLVINYESFQLMYGVVDNGATDITTSLSFYDGSLNLGISAGLFLSSGSGIVPTSNTESNFSGEFADFNLDPDAELQTAVHAAFDGAGEVTDFTTLSFSFEVTDPSVKGIRFDLVFGSDEYPEFVDSPYVDIAGVFVNGKNYALFNGEATQPLSVLKNNLAAGNFIDNSATIRNIEFDGLSAKLEIVAPVQFGVNTIKVAIGDTGDTVLDSGLFVANFAPSNYQGFGLTEVISLATGKVAANDNLGNQLYKLDGGFNYLNLLGGDDIVEVSPSSVGVSYVNVPYAFSELLGGGFSGGVLSLQGPTGSSILSNVSKVGLKDILVAMDTNQGEATWNAMALLNAAIKSANDPALLAQWSAAAETAGDLNALAKSFLDHYFPSGLPVEALVGHLLGTVAGIQGNQELIGNIVDQIGEGKTFATASDFFGFAAGLDLNTSQFADLVGNLVVLDKQVYDSLL
jgi:hypothetical protein